MESAPNHASALLPHVRALRFLGRDVLDVLNRVSSNDVARLPAGDARTTLFCDFRGRLLHRAVVAHAADGAVWLLSDSPGEALAAFVDSRVFREDVRLDGGPADVPAPLVPLAAAAFGATLRERIEAGLPAYGHEVTEAFNAYEAGLAAEVHLAKGCYTGQEALQRLVTYDSVRRERVRFSGAGDPPAPQDVLADGDGAGRLTSAAATGSGWVALAIVRVAVLEAGTPLTLADGTPLPAPHRFPVARPLGR
jgi:folate-binding protein YgfZ